MADKSRVSKWAPIWLGITSSAYAFGGAHAADQVVVEAEPVEYVRLCDAYGSGFFYIPGTETCLRFGGYVRSTYQKAILKIDDGSQINGALVNFIGVTDDIDSTFWGHRARLNVDVRSETDFGTLRGLMRLEAGDGDSDASQFDMDVALISLAGFRAGFAGSNYWSSNHGFGWVNSEGIGGAAGGIAADQGPDGFSDGSIFDYTWTDQGLAVTVGVEDPAKGSGRDFFGNFTNNGGPDGRVNFYAGANYTASWGDIAFTAVHDSLAPEVQTISAGGFTGSAITDVGGWAFRVSGHLNLADFIPGASIWGNYMWDGKYNTDYVTGNGIIENPDSIWAVAFQMDLGSEHEFWVNYSEIDGGQGHIFNTAGLTTFNFAGAKFINGTGIEEGGVRQFGVGLNWYPKAAPGFSVKASYVRGEADNAAHILVCDGSFPVGGPTGCSFSYEAFSVTLRRSF